ncbi:MAG: hypothetical protein LBH93_00965 [Chitinispirillales bacterium]|jgi:hypothetical protein|nr:hypothetical protein [Chitinispirillales bacterium]
MTYRVVLLKVKIFKAFKILKSKFLNSFKSFGDWGGARNAPIHKPPPISILPQKKRRGRILGDKAALDVFFQKIDEKGYRGIFRRRLLL